MGYGLWVKLIQRAEPHLVLRPRPLLRAEDGLLHERALTEA
jgi:hypothetical protein